MAYAVAATNTLDNQILQGLTEVQSTAAHDVGYTTKSTDEREYVYRFVSTNMTAAPVATYPAFFLAGAGKGDDVTTTYTAGDLGRNFAGVLCALVAAGGNYMWAQTKGYVPSTRLSSNVAAGETLTCMETGMLTDVLANSISTNPDASILTYDSVSVGNLGTALEAYSSGVGDAVLK